MKPIIEFVKVTKIYKPDIAALEDVSFTVTRGEMLFLSGRSGAGKTTLLKLISCLEPPTRGVIEVNDSDLARLRPRQIQSLRQTIGMAYQDFRLLPRLTVYQNIAMAMEVAYVGRQVINKRVDDLLNMLMLNDKKDTPAGNLSRGEQQRVTIARAAANSPPIFLADEPTGNLDATITWHVMDLFKQLNDAGTTLLIATHDTSILEKTPCRVLELKDGKIHALREAGSNAAPSRDRNRPA